MPTLPSALKPCPTDDGRHKWIFESAKFFTKSGTSPEYAEQWIRSRLTRPEKRGEIAHAISQAWGYAYNSSQSVPTEKVASPNSLGSSRASSDLCRAFTDQSDREHRRLSG